MNNKIVIASVLMAAALTGIFSTTMAAYAAEDNGGSSETNEEAKVKEKATTSGHSDAFNCGNVNFHSDLNVHTCISEQGDEIGLP